MRKFDRWLLAGALLLASIVAPAARAATDPVAVVAAVKGRVEISTGHSRAAVRAVFGRALERGDKVTVGTGGSATLFFNDGNVIELSERSALTIGGRVVAGAHSAALPGDVFAQVSRFVTAGSRQTGLVAMADMRSDADASLPLLLAPRRSAVLDDAPTLRWRTVIGAKGYRVRVTTASGAEVWTREVAATDGAEQALAYPGDAPRLVAATEHGWEVEAFDAKGTLRRESTTLRVLGSEARGSVRTNLARITESAGGERSPAARFLAGSYLSGLGLYEEATLQFRALAALDPASPAPHEALGNLYLSVGLTDRAAAEFQHALALQRDAR
ncbi:MAG: hypothetical protein HOP12_05835 [Candidatus Eisenbacteria bacterium]|uniref:Tetratricopeptide repeat protein n=1 Tax=Eiseniibacteriota bacterium TaxID=2212470 RepID=A0A849SLG4_UNCEI|nr:hypothetical protein [Candidatus Eisenbacteria bacterium]